MGHVNSGFEEYSTRGAEKQKTSFLGNAESSVYYLEKLKGKQTDRKLLVLTGSCSVR